MINLDYILQSLPHYQGHVEERVEDQFTVDIIREVLDGHVHFKNDYDNICMDFYSPNPVKLAKNIFDFCKQNIEYDEETEKIQSIKSPGAILITGKGDCKHMASMTAGILDALRRKGKNIKFNYRFAGYGWLDQINEHVRHVFVVLDPGKNEIWIDAVMPELDSRKEIPSYIIDFKILPMIQRLSGIERQNQLYEFNELPGDDSVLVSLPVGDMVEGEIVKETKPEPLPSDIEQAIKLLLYYKIIDPQTQVVSDIILSDVISKLESQSDVEKLVNAFGLFTQHLQNQTLAGFLDDLWDGVKTVALAPLRGAFLGLVSLNVFNLAGRLQKALYEDSGKLDEESLQRIRGVWVHKFEGQTDALLKAVANGARKNPILGSMQKMGVVAAAVPAWVATAGAILAVILPVIKSILQKKAFEGQTGISYADISGDYGGGSLNDYVDGGNSIMDFLPWIIAGSAALFLISKK